MEVSKLNRRSFIQLSTLGGLGFSLKESGIGKIKLQKEIKVGVIGLDTSHCIAFAKTLNDPNVPESLSGCRIIAAYPYGSLNIKSSASRIPNYVEAYKKMGIEIFDSEEELLKNVDAILLETNDGRRHYEQALKVFKAGKPIFIDKPLAATLSDVIAIIEAAKHYKVPMYSASSLRYTKNALAVRNKGIAGELLAAETIGPADEEKTHTPLYWMGIHGVEPLFTMLGSDCRQVRNVYTPNSSVVVGEWNGGRLGTFLGLRTGREDFGGKAFGRKEIIDIGPYQGYKPMLVDIVKLFKAGIQPVDLIETRNIYAFMTAAYESRLRGGAAVSLEEVIDNSMKDLSLEF